MKEFLDYLRKNKYVFICVGLVILLYSFGIVNFLAKFLVLVALIIGAIFIGKMLQDNENIMKTFFSKIKYKNDEEVYYYQDKEDKK